MVWSNFPLSAVLEDVIRREPATKPEICAIKRHTCEARARNAKRTVYRTGCRIDVEDVSLEGSGPDRIAASPGHVLNPIIADNRNEAVQLCLGGVILLDHVVPEIWCDRPYVPRAVQRAAGGPTLAEVTDKGPCSRVRLHRTLCIEAEKYRRCGRAFCNAATPPAASRPGRNV